jgi:hypothetical protein
LIGLLGLGILVHQVAFFVLLVLGVERASEERARAPSVADADAPAAIR